MTLVVGLLSSCLGGQNTVPLCMALAPFSAAEQNQLVEELKAAHVVDGSMTQRAIDDWISLRAQASACNSAKE